MKPSSEIDRLIYTVSKSADYLEPEAYEAVCSFIRQSQCPSGAFADRGGSSDWYYSLFGFLLCEAFNLKPELHQLKQFVLRKNNKRKNNIIDWTVWALLRYSFNRSFLFKFRISFQLLFQWIFKRKKVPGIYQVFLNLMILNHFWGWVRFIALYIDQLTSSFILNYQPPTSHIAAALIIRKQAGLDVRELIDQLLKNAHAEGGFVAFTDQNTADMLSTAVAGYALSQAKADLRLYTSYGLSYISENFDNGAFLSGDGDLTRDLEYTFYGLLALSSFAQQPTAIRQ